MIAVCGNAAPPRPAHNDACNAAELSARGTGEKQPPFVQEGGGLAPRSRCQCAETMGSGLGGPFMCWRVPWPVEGQTGRAHGGRGVPRTQHPDLQAAVDKMDKIGPPVRSGLTFKGVLLCR